MTRVALLNGNWYPQTGGGIVHVDELARRLVADHGCEVDIITKRTAPEGDRRVPDGASLVQIAGTDSSFRLLNELRYTSGVVNYVRQREFDIVHAHTNTATFPLQMVGLLDDARTVLTVHGANLDLSVTFTGSVLDYVYTAVRRTILQRFRYDAVVSVSRELADVLSPHHERVRFIANGVDVNAFPDPAGYGNKELLFVGRLRPKKNPADIVRAMRHVTKRHPDAMLHIVGEGPLYDDVTDSVQQLGLEEHVTVHGYVDNKTLQQLYKACSVFVLPSDWEGHPLVLMEAWASGQPVVGTDVEGIREFVNEGYGELVPPNDPEALGETLSELLANRDTVAAMGTDARSFVESEYSWRSTVERTYRLYREMLATADDEVDSSRRPSGRPSTRT
jgi:glycosyltransferase involved in cell wall biosynthesis